MIDKDRLRNPLLYNRVISADAAAELITDGMTVATSGFSPAGYPKTVPFALARQVENGRKVKINLWTGSSVGPELENELARVGAIARRMPFLRYTNRYMQQGINSGQISFCDTHLSHMAQMANYGFLGDIDVAIIEAEAITAEGGIIPTTSVGNSPIYARLAKKLIVELNTTQPLELEGMHDIYIQDKPPYRNPIPITRVGDRIGTPSIEVGLDRITAIVESNIPDPTSKLTLPNDETQRISDHLINFLQLEVKKGRLPKNLLPLQSGLGNIGNAVLAGLASSPFEHLKFFSEMIQPAAFDLIDNGKVDAVSTTCFTADPSVLKRISDAPSRYRKVLVLRPADISNHPELIRRLGVIALNTPLEVDIYGQVNSSHIMGSRIMNGIGGSGDYMRNGYISIFTTESTTKDGAISRIVPMVAHVDHTEHDWNILITEQGIADLRGLSPRERAKSIINNCAHPDYRPMLWDYFNRACKRNGNSPHLLEEALSWHVRSETTGTMLP